MSHTYLPLRQRGLHGVLMATGGLVLAGALAFTLLAAPAEAAKHKKKRGPVVVKTMTRNLYLGSSLGDALNAGSVPQLCTGSGQVLRDVDESKPVTRMRAIGNEIARRKPDLVGLQEVARWSIQTPSDGGDAKYNLGAAPGAQPAPTAKYDFLQLILQRLRQRGTPYRVASVSNNFEFEIPIDYDGNPATGSAGGSALGCHDAESDGRMLIRDVILARRAPGVRTARRRAANFNQRLVLPLAGDIGFPVLRGWTAVNATVRGSRPFRFVNTHLEAFDSQASGNAMCTGCTFPYFGATTPVTRASIRRAQANEVVTGPARARIPTILVGDLNSNVPGVQEGDHQAFQRVLQAGFKRRSTQNPASCCADLFTGTLADFDHVVDHIMGKPGKRVRPGRSHVFGRARVDGVYPSDHAGVFSAVKVPRKPIRRRRR